MLDQQRLDLLLGDRLAAPLLAGLDQLGVLSRN